MKKISLACAALSAVLLIASCSFDLPGTADPSLDAGQETGELVAADLVGSLAPDGAEARALGGIPIGRCIAANANLVAVGIPGEVPLAGTYTGRNAVLGYFRQFTSAVAMTGVEPQEILAEGNAVNVHLRLKGRVRATGSSFDIEFVYAMMLEKGRVRSITVYCDTAVFRKAFTEPGPALFSDIRNPSPVAWDPADRTDYKSIVRSGYEVMYSPQTTQADIIRMVTGFDMATGAFTDAGLCHPEIAWVFKGDPVVPFSGFYSGWGTPFGPSGGLLDFFGLSSYFNRIVDISYEIGPQRGNKVDSYITESSYVISGWNANGTPVYGRSYTVRSVHSFTFRDGKIAEFKTHNDSWSVAKAFAP